MHRHKHEKISQAKQKQYAVVWWCRWRIPETSAKVPPSFSSPIRWMQYKKKNTQ